MQESAPIGHCAQDQSNVDSAARLVSDNLALAQRMSRHAGHLWLLLSFVLDTQMFDAQELLVGS